MDAQIMCFEKTTFPILNRLNYYDVTMMKIIPRIIAQKKGEAKRH